jgi:G3E family GTPase
LPKPDCRGLIVPVPILLVTGFLGAGKTTVVNHLLAHAEGRRIAALVNDFGAINIDAELIAGASDGVISLSNGCICCSLQGDLLRTLAALLRRDPRPELIVIETSGGRRSLGYCAQPDGSPDLAGGAAGNGAVRVGRDDTGGNVERRGVAVSVADGRRGGAEQGGPGGRGGSRAAARYRPGAVSGGGGGRCLHGEVSATLLFPAEADRVSAPREPGPRRPSADRFETLSWTSERPVSVPRLQQAIGRLAPKLARAKGLFETVEQPGRLMVFQLAGGRATLAPGGALVAGVPRARIVFIAEIGVLSIAEIDRIMEECTETG